MTDIVPPTADEMREIIAAHQGLEGPLLPILHAMQDTFGYVPEDAVALIADALNQTRAEIHGTISFYHDFRRAPAGRHVLKICRAEACQAMGGAQLAAATLGKLGVDWHGTNANGAVTVEPVYCLGMCACAPAAMMDDRVAARLDEAGMGELLAEAGA
ncbi:formate dehydrogenase subunit gamma [Roseivivax sediminis]|uniref:Formate dehydrogenase gamma subunit n=1 Tax=Roseivivax sediminis TaxID=936889 RepID=A0A1I2CSN0_9RHOB|nr:formate dehydrogenase subunit gamma [Roseivivax sediminis]SFE71172.1 formate dehydrogenase gamma subunit [Roseivivax sediminis]